MFIFENLANRIDQENILKENEKPQSHHFEHFGVYFGEYIELIL